MEQKVYAFSIFDEMDQVMISNWKEHESNFIEVQKLIIEHIKQFLAYGHDVNTRYRVDKSISFLSLSVKGLPLVVKYLVEEAAADINLKTSRISLLHEALKESYQSGYSVECCSAQAKDCKEIALFLVNQENIIVNCVDSQNQTPLHIACNNHGKTPRYSFDEIIEVLLQKGANPDVPDGKNQTPRNYYNSSKKGHIDSLIARSKVIIEDIKNKRVKVAGVVGASNDLDFQLVDEEDTRVWEIERDKEQKIKFVKFVFVLEDK